MSLKCSLFVLLIIFSLKTSKDETHAEYLCNES